MKRKAFGVILAVLSMFGHLYAADGDLIVNGKLGVGTTNPGQKLEVTGNIRASGETIGTLGSGAAQFRAVYGNYGTMIRADGAYTHVLLTASGDQYGGWNSLRPFSINNVTGNMQLGNSSLYIVHNGNVGVGTTAPSSKLEVAGNLSLNSSQPALTMYDQSGSVDGRHFSFWNVIGGIYGRWINDANNAVVAESIYLKNNGNVGIGTTSPSYKLHVGADSAAKPSTNTWTIASDARLKENIKPYTKGLNEVIKIEPVSYNYNGKGGIGHHKVKMPDPTGVIIETDVIDKDLLAKSNIGVIAQDIKNIVPEAVTSHKGKIDESDPVETDILDFNSHALTFVMINAIKELKAEVDELKQQIEDLKSKIK